MKQKKVGDLFHIFSFSLTMRRSCLEGVRVPESQVITDDKQRNPGLRFWRPVSWKITCWLAKGTLLRPIDPSELATSL